MTTFDLVRVNHNGLIGKVIEVNGDKVKVEFEAGFTLTCDKSEVRYFS